MRWRWCVSAVLLALSTGIVASPLAQESEPTADPTEPFDVQFREHTTRDLIQLDVSVSGPADLIDSLSAEDFELSVGYQPIEEFIVDRLCTTSPPMETTIPSPAVSYVFYFDQHHLNMMGRQNSIDLSKILVAELAQSGGKVSLVSAGKRLRTLADFTDDVDSLRDALNDLEDDHEQWDEYASLELNRITELKSLGMTASLACMRAREFKNDDTWHTERALQVFSLMLNRFAHIDPPKVVLYFGDTLRLNPGQHYIRAAGRDCQGGTFDSRAMFDRVIEEASALGVRVYAVQAEGLVPPSMLETAVRSSRMRDAEGGLKALALETGGDAFLGGYSTKNIGARMLSDMSCLYLLSFDSGSLPRDKGLPVRVRVKRRGVKAKTRGRLVAQSPGARRTSRLLAAFGAPTAVRSDVPVAGTIVPVAYEKGRYTALVQLVVHDDLLPTGDWDLGASLVSRGTVRDDWSEHLTVKTISGPMVVEAEVRFRPGPFEIVMVAHEGTTGRVGTRVLEGEWPARETELAIPSIAALQPMSGAFVRGGEVRGEGALAVPTNGTLRRLLGTAIIGLVCRGRGQKGKVVIRRSITGDHSAEFPALVPEFSGDRCVQFRDLIPPGTLKPGDMTYTTTVFQAEREKTSSSVSFTVK